MDLKATRRTFIKTAATGSVAAIGLPSIVNAAFAGENFKKTGLKKDDILLFQGDSITDWGRDRSKTAANDAQGLGTGYAYLTSAELLKSNPDKNLQIFNKGVSGNKVYELINRWNDDCINLKPTVLSIMIGVNDFWHTVSFGYKGTLEVYKTDYKKLLDQTQKALPGIRLVIGEPFAVKGVKAVDDKWYPTFNSYRETAREIANEYGATFIPYQSVFDKAQESAPGSYWTSDGVHPSIAGASLMSHAWLKAVGA
ncbi:SGNH/GDSL hydrolase family protein [Mucilaginibacter gynuensis]|uniref:SGNH/GDSL hydrolase family protein n=1 Tax=Mucilaginibacter gynuensis TaxID=1302236 RepID=A0ABP8HNS3_9SPHI